MSAVHREQPVAGAVPETPPRVPAQWRNLAALAVVVFGAALVAFFLLKPAAVDSGASRNAAPQQGSVAPFFALRSTTGATVSLRSLRGHPVLLNFWFTNCPPCRSEMPDLQRAYSAMRAHGVVIVGIDAVGEDVATIKAFSDPLGITYPLLVDLDQHVTTLYRVNATPSSFFIDRRGLVHSIHAGPLTAAAVQSGLQGL